MRVLQKHGLAALLFSLLLLFLFSSCALAENGSVSGMVWVEKTVDGIFGAGDSAYANGAKVTLERKNESGQAEVYINKVSDRTGNFVFPNLPAGEYRIRTEVTSEYRFTLHGMGSASLPARGNVSYTPYFYLGEGQSLTQNIGLTKTYCAVSLLAFVDENSNGGRMQGEDLVSGVQAELLYEYGGETYVVASGTTDRNGELTIRELSPGTFRVRVTMPNNLVVGPLGQKINTFYNCMLPQEDNTGLSAPFTLEAKESIGMGVGMVRTGSLTGRVWYDGNYNGLWDGDEAGLTQAAITLVSPSLGLSRSAAPEGDGRFTFLGLQPGEYRLEYQLPQGMIFTYPGMSMISETASWASVTVSVQVDVTTDLGAVGAMPSAGLTLRLYEDSALNGVAEEGDPPVLGAVVTAYQGGKALETVTTDETGCAVFHTLRGGETALSVSLPGNYVFSADQQGLFPVNGANAYGETTLWLDGAQAQAEYSAAVTLPGALSGTLFEDSANSGLYQAGSAYLPGFTVQAVNALGQVALETVTDENGAYTLYPLMPGDYSIRFLMHSDYVAAAQAEEPQGMYNHITVQNPDFGETDRIALAPGMGISGLDASAFRAGRVEGRVFLDEEFAQPGTGMSGVSVVLLNDQGQPASAYSYGETDETGYFSIKGVLPGAYSLRYILPDNGQFTDPDILEKRYETTPFTTESGSEVSVPALHGIYTATLAGRILYDGLETDENFSAILSLVGQNVHQAFQIRAQADGSFAFTGLKPDTYLLNVVLPDYLVFGELEGSPIQASAEPAASAEIVLAMGESYLGADILASVPVSVSGLVYYDDNLSGDKEAEEFGAEDRALSLWRNGEEVAAVTTDEKGLFQIEHLIPANYELRLAVDENEVLVNVEGAEETEGAYLLPVYARSDFAAVLPIMRYASVEGQVWSLDGSYSGVGGLSVSLLNAEGDLAAEAVTDETGAYRFIRLLPGDYTLSTQLPQGHLFARSQDTLYRESYIQGSADGTPHSLSFFVPMGDDLSGVDIGMGAMGEIGDRAWLDENGNGMQDIGEPGMPGIEIALYQHGELIAAATTNEYGKYMISDVYPGEYEMRVTMHPELKATLRQTEFPLVASILPESGELTVSVEKVIVPSGGRNLHCDVGFQLRKKDTYPAAMELIPQKDWRPYSDR